MIEDLKTVIITFGIIALVFLQGSLMYQKKIYNDYVLATSQEQTQKAKASKIAATRSLVQDQLKQQQELAKLNSQITQNQTTLNTATSPTPADIARQQALLLAKQQASAKLLAQQKAQSQQAQVTTSPSRQSSAS